MAHSWLFQRLLTTSGRHYARSVELARNDDDNDDDDDGNKANGLNDKSKQLNKLAIGNDLKMYLTVQWTAT